ncbi:MAG: DUF4097 domain-containing protein [Roseburia sp.]|nr:DUF4097 domain-containing protein [Roseburia sp.]MCM1097680.1 DUF4097 domain-containing protein [Ruminococcus flavefaciens]
MKTVRIAAIVLISILTLFLASLLWSGLSGGGWPFRVSVETRTDCSLVQEKEFSAEEISSLRVLYYDFMEIYFYENDEETVLVREYLNFTPKENQLSEIKLDRSTLSVKGKKRRFSLSFSLRPSPYGYAEIYLPSGLYENLEAQTVSGDILSELPFTLSGRFSVSTTSGSVTFPDVEASAFSASTTSGDLSFSKAAAKEISASTTSGKISLSVAQADDISVSTTSGDITLSEAQGGKVSVSTTSGEVQLDAVSGKSFRLSAISGDAVLGQLSCDAELSATSGSVRIEKAEGGLDVETVSGSILIENAENGLDAETTSGSILVENVKNKADAETTSGDIRLKTIQGAFNLSTTSGNITVESGSGFGKADTISGEIRLFLDQGLLGDLSLSGTSGDMTLSLPETAAFRLDFESASGSCNTFFDDQLSFNKRGTHVSGQYGDNPENELSVSTTSGSLRITKVP